MPIITYHLPSTTIPQPQRVFGGQRFIYHQGSNSSNSDSWRRWEKSTRDLKPERDCGITEANEGLSSVVVVRGGQGAVLDRQKENGGEL